VGVTMPDWPWAHTGVPLLGAVAAGAMALGVIAAVLRRHRTQRELESRVRLVALPSEGFDPSEEEILRFAHQLARARRGFAGLAVRRASAVTVRMESSPGGRVLYAVEVPGRSRSLLEAGLFDGVELVDPSEVDPAAGGPWPSSGLDSPSSVLGVVASGRDGADGGGENSPRQEDSPW
jgi:hypothetical protein